MRKTRRFWWGIIFAVDASLVQPCSFWFNSNNHMSTNMKSSQPLPFSFSRPFVWLLLFFGYALHCHRPASNKIVCHFVHLSCSCIHIVHSALLYSCNMSILWMAFNCWCCFSLLQRTLPFSTYELTNFSLCYLFFSFIFFIHRWMGYNVKYYRYGGAEQTIIGRCMPWIEYAAHRKRCIYTHREHSV